MSFEAQFPGECSKCEQPITPGQQIASAYYVGSGYHPVVYHHVVCPVVRPRVVCPDCFMEKAANGSCGCDE